MFDTKILPPDDGRTHPLGDARRHLNLVRTMAKATGIDLELAQARGTLPVTEWADAITRCRGCQHADICTQWLETREREVEEVPAECANIAMFAALQAID